MSACPACWPNDPAAREADRCELHDHNLRVEVPRGALRLILARYLAGDTSVDPDSDRAANELGRCLLRIDADPDPTPWEHWHGQRYCDEIGCPGGAA